MVRMRVLLALAAGLMIAPGAQGRTLVAQRLTTPGAPATPTAPPAQTPGRASRSLPSARPRDPLGLRAAQAAANRAYARYLAAHARSARANSVAAPRASVFDGLAAPGLAATSTITPPDSTGAIGPSNYVEMVNSEIAVYDRASLAAPVATVDEPSFVGTPAASVCDGQMQWDEQGQRWEYAALNCDASHGSENLYVGWSRTPDPTGTWCAYEIATASSMEDYPKLGHDDSQIIIGTNGFSDTTGNYTASHLFIVDKPAPGDTTCPVTASATEETLPNAFTPVPANIADDSSLGYVAAIPTSVSDNTHVLLYAIGRDGAGASTIVSSTAIGVPAYDMPAAVPQPGSTDTLDPSDERLTQAVAVTDPATGREGIWTQHTVAGSDGGPAFVAWYELTPGASLPRQWGAVSGPDGQFAFNGAISPTSDGRSAAIFYNAGDGRDLVSLHAQDRHPSTPLGAMTEDVTLATSGAVDADFSCPSHDRSADSCRWGDYAGASPDPDNPALIWGTSQLTMTAASPGDPQWTTQNVALALGTVPAPASAAPPTIAGDPVEGQTLTLTGGSWSNTPTVHVEHWERCDAAGAGCQAIAGATDATYLLTLLDVGHTIRVLETASNDSGSASASSAATGAVQPRRGPSTAPPANASPPTIAGAAVPGVSLSATPGTWTGSPTSFSYAWQRCRTTCETTSGGPTYFVSSDDMGASVQVLVTAWNLGGSAQAASAALGPVRVAAAQVREALAAVLSPRGPTAHISRLLPRGGYAMPFNAPSAGVLTVRWSKRVRGKTVVVARARAEFSRPRAATVTLRLTAAGRRLLRRASRVRAVARASFAPVGQSAVSVRRTVTLSR